MSIADRAHEYRACKDAAELGHALTAQGRSGAALRQTTLLTTALICGEA
jgi:Xaa-Pro aminopeptidase